MVISSQSLIVLSGESDFYYNYYEKSLQFSLGDLENTCSENNLFCVISSCHNARFEYPPAKTPKKKRLSMAGKDKTVQVCS